MKLERRGYCNRCGLCCKDSEHIIILPSKSIGEPYSTACSVWGEDPYHDGWPHRPKELTIPQCTYQFVLIDNDRHEHILPLKNWRDGAWHYPYWDPSTHSIGMTLKKELAL